MQRLKNRSIFTPVPKDEGAIPGPSSDIVSGAVDLDNSPTTKECAQDSRFEDTTRLDPALWPSNIAEQVRDYWMTFGPRQHRDCANTYTDFERFFGTGKRFFFVILFRTEANERRIEAKKLAYSLTYDKKCILFHRFAVW